MSFVKEIKKDLCLVYTNSGTDKTVKLVTAAGDNDSNAKISVHLSKANLEFLIAELQDIHKKQYPEPSVVDKYLERISRLISDWKELNGKNPDVIIISHDVYTTIKTYFGLNFLPENTERNLYGIKCIVLASTSREVDLIELGTT